MTFAMNRFSKSVTLDTTPHMPAGDTGAAAKADLGKLPEWNRLTSTPAESAELKADLEKAAKDAADFETRWKGKLGEEAAKANGGNFADAIKEYEGLSELMGRIASFAGLYYYGDTTDSKRMKLFGDVQQKLTDANTPLIFFSLEINRIDDDVLEKAMASNPAIGHYRPWLEDLRLDKPYELDDKLEQLFHEKSITGYSAGTACLMKPCRACVLRSMAKNWPSSRRSTCCRTQMVPCAKGIGSTCQDFRRKPAHFHADYQYAGQGQGNLRPLAWFSGHCRQPPSCQSR